MAKKAWSGRFSENESPLMELFNASLPVDQRLYVEDILGSLAHAGTLKKSGILTAAEHSKISVALKKIQQLLSDGKFKFRAGDEDIHMAIEAKLAQLIGPVAGKLHTARSRNDQVALDTKLYVRQQTALVQKKIRSLQKIFLELAETNLGVIMPGYTHLQRAQAVYLSHHLLAYFEMLQRDFSRFNNNASRLVDSPLGAGALAGTSVPIDRQATATMLGFSDYSHNSLDTVADRDFILDFLFAASVLMMHLSRLCEELVLWSSQEFSFVSLPRDFCTGSSIMPQKINPDAPELIRGKTGRVYGNLLALLTTMKALPLAYNKDMQEDKEPLFDSVDTVLLCLEVLIHMLPQISFHTDNMLKATQDGFLLATDFADYLVAKNIPFRQAHAIVGKLVRYCEQKNMHLEDLDLKTLKNFSAKFDRDVYKLTVLNSVNARRSLGGTALANVKKELKRARKILTYA